jgi:copper(I)-binding protein
MKRIEEAVIVTRSTGRALSATRLRMALAAAALLIPVLAGCEAGLDAPTLAFHPAGNGTTLTSGDVTINNAFVLGPDVGQTLAAGQNAGLFLSLTATGGDQLESVNTSGVASSAQIVNSPVSISPGQPANLTGPDPNIVLQNLSAPLSGGQVITLSLVFAKAGTVQVKVPVMPHAFEYATFAPAS